LAIGERLHQNLGQDFPRFLALSLSKHKQPKRETCYRAGRPERGGQLGGQGGVLMMLEKKLEKEREMEMEVNKHDDHVGICSQF
jgi:hypothetical protein